jgi:hypothetical protein
MMVVTWPIKKWRAHFHRGEEVVGKVGQLQQHSTSANKVTKTLSFYVNKGHQYNTNNIYIYIYYKICTDVKPNFSFEKLCFQFLSFLWRFTYAYIWWIFKLVLVIYQQLFVVSYTKAWSSRNSLCLRWSWLNCSPHMFTFSTVVCTFNKPYFCNNISLWPPRIVTYRIFIVSSNCGV